MSLPVGLLNSRRERWHYVLTGYVQGVGFRPFVLRLANEFGLTGQVSNTSAGVELEVQGERSQLRLFQHRLLTELPFPSKITDWEKTKQCCHPEERFVIRASIHEGVKSAPVLPDLATCEECFKDIFDPANRRYHYPFTNCTHCGPRFSIIESVPYDRINTTMRQFSMCPRCLEEYHDPLNRRFHAQANACPDCGPQLALWDSSRKVLAHQGDALKQAAEAMIQGKIVAVKGLGGFQLSVDATNEDAVRRLRERKQRPDKPFALMMKNVVEVQRYAKLSAFETEVLTSAAAPIVIVACQAETAGVTLASGIAPGYQNIGVMLPTTPLHHLLMQIVDRPLVMTSGNVSEEPICIEDIDALNRLAQIADIFLVHDRPIVRALDDSIVRCLDKQTLPIRLARGYAPVSLEVTVNVSGRMALGGQLKNTVALGLENRIVLSQHIGDLENELAVKSFQDCQSSLRQLHDAEVKDVVIDEHPDYVSSRLAQPLGKLIYRVQHHHAHVAAVMAEKQLTGPVLGVAWDGTGWGPDGTVWGGEFLTVDGAKYQRVASFRPFPLPGGEVAVREPRRSALGLIVEWNKSKLGSTFPESIKAAFSAVEINAIKQMLERSFNSPLTTSVGRLYDAVAFLLGLVSRASFEGQGAERLEQVLRGTEDQGVYSFDLLIDKDQQWRIDWGAMLQGILIDLNLKTDSAQISRKFHDTLVEILVSVAREIRMEDIVLSGGCFQNAYLSGKAKSRLQKEGFSVFLPEKLPVNDGALAVGQLWVAAHQGKRG